MAIRIQNFQLTMQCMSARHSERGQNIPVLTKINWACLFSVQEKRQHVFGIVSSPTIGWNLFWRRILAFMQLQFPKIFWETASYLNLVQGIFFCSKEETTMCLELSPALQWIKIRFEGAFMLATAVFRRFFDHELVKLGPRNSFVGVIVIRWWLSIW